MFDEKKNQGQKIPNDTVPFTKQPLFRPIGQLLQTNTTIFQTNRTNGLDHKKQVGKTNGTDGSDKMVQITQQMVQATELIVQTPETGG